MSEVNDLHNKAMNLAELALIERLRGDLERESGLARQALEFELAAIDELEAPIEPTFSVLHRSAGTLALRCHEYRLAEQIAAKALALEPPHEIAEELRDLIEQVHFQRHLELRGIELAPDEVQMSLSGKEVGYGLVTSDELVSRIGNASRLIGRIVDRQRQSPFSERGPRKTTREALPSSRFCAQSCQLLGHLKGWSSHGTTPSSSRDRSDCRRIHGLDGDDKQFRYSSIRAAYPAATLFAELPWARKEDSPGWRPSPTSWLHSGKGS